MNPIEDSILTEQIIPENEKSMLRNQSVMSNTTDKTTTAKINVPQFIKEEKKPAKGKLIYRYSDAAQNQSFQDTDLMQYLAQNGVDAQKNTIVFNKDLKKKNLINLEYQEEAPHCTTVLGIRSEY